MENISITDGSSYSYSCPVFDNISYLCYFVFTTLPYETEDSGIIKYVKQWSVAITDTLSNSLVILKEHFWLYVPLGIIGLWRWLTWGVKDMCRIL